MPATILKRRDYYDDQTTTNGETADSDYMKLICCYILLFRDAAAAVEQETDVYGPDICSNIV